MTFVRDWANEGAEPDDFTTFCYICGNYDDDCSCDIVDASDFCPTCDEQHPCKCEFARIITEEMI